MPQEEDGIKSRQTHICRDPGIHIGHLRQSKHNHFWLLRHLSLIYAHIIESQKYHRNIVDVQKRGKARQTAFADLTMYVGLFSNLVSLLLNK
jgi:hypothetical protein